MHGLLLGSSAAANKTSTVYEIRVTKLLLGCCIHHQNKEHMVTTMSMTTSVTVQAVLLVSFYQEDVSFSSENQHVDSVMKKGRQHFAVV